MVISINLSPIGAWKSNFSPFYEIMTTEYETNKRADVGKLLFQ